MVDAITLDKRDEDETGQLVDDPEHLREADKVKPCQGKMIRITLVRGKKTNLVIGVDDQRNDIRKGKEGDSCQCGRGEGRGGGWGGDPDPHKTLDVCSNTFSVIYPPMFVTSL